MRWYDASVRHLSFIFSVFRSLCVLLLLLLNVCVCVSLHERKTGHIHIWRRWLRCVVDDDDGGESWHTLQALCVAKSRRLNTFNIIMNWSIHTHTPCLQYDIISKYLNRMPTQFPLQMLRFQMQLLYICRWLPHRYAPVIHTYLSSTACICIQLRQSWINKLQLFSVK